MPDARDIAYDITRRVNSGGGYLNLLLKYRLDESELDSRDRALVSELAYGMQRQRNKLDYIINSFSRRPLAKIQPDVQDLLRLGVYQLSEMRVPAHASVNETVDLAKRRVHRKAASFINAVLRNAAGRLGELQWPSRSDFPYYLETVHSHPRWLVDHMLGYMSHDEAEALCIANNAVPGLTLRLNQNKIDVETIMSEIHLHGGDARRSQYLQEALKEVHVRRDLLLDFLEKGYCVVQDESSMLVSHVVDPQPGSLIVDACAAPGGKSVHLALLGGEGCKVIALDKNPGRLTALRNAVSRSGLLNVDVREGDAVRLEEFMDSHADAVLVDAPCSGLGTLRKNPELKWRRLPEEIHQLAWKQLALLEGCAASVRPGGTLVYSVCTFTREETLDVLGRFLNTHHQFLPEDLAPHIPPALRKGVNPEGHIQLMPHLHGMEGMFIARLLRRL